MRVLCLAGLVAAVSAAVREGAADYILKPLDPHLLRASLGNPGLLRGILEKAGKTAERTKLLESILSSDLKDEVARRIENEFRPVSVNPAQQSPWATRSRVRALPSTSWMPRLRQSAYQPLSLSAPQSFQRTE